MIQKEAEDMLTELHPLLQSYYTETKPDVRKKHLDEYSKAADAEADRYRKELYSCRHVDKKHPEKQIDRFLFNLISLTTMFKTPGIFPKFRKREVLSIIKEMQLDARPLQDPLCRDALYWEYRNAVRRYIATCSDPSYGRKLLGMVASDEASRKAQCCQDVWAFSYGVAELVGAQNEMEILCRASNDEYCALTPEAESLEADYKKYTR
jgi:hypothetical protein